MKTYFIAYIFLFSFTLFGQNGTKKSTEKESIEIPVPRLIQITEDTLSDEAIPEIRYENTPIEDEIIDFPDTMAEFPGGEDAMFKFINKNLIYPESCKEMAIQGRVYLSFIVEKTGELTNITILRGVHKDIDNEAKRLIKIMPKWKAAVHENKLVRSKYIIPIKFILQ